jgi:hypothetical protein
MEEWIRSHKLKWFERSMADAYERTAPQNYGGVSEILLDGHSAREL